MVGRTLGEAGIDFMTATDHTLISDLHAAYCSLTGLDVPLTQTRRFKWEEWLWRDRPKDTPRTKDSLAVVIKYLRSHHAGKPWAKQVLAFRKIVEDHGNFDETLAMANAERRNHKPVTNRDSVLKATYRLMPASTEPRTAAQIMEADMAFAKFKAWREQEGI